jgi:DnaK suppressor protein
MDQDRAAQLLAEAHERTLGELRRATRGNLEEEIDDADDSASRAGELTEQMVGGALSEELSARLAAIERAERRLAEGTYGRSVSSGEPIPDARLEVMPWAEQTAPEAAGRHR